MIITENKQGVIEYWNKDRAGKIELLAAACMWEARATICNALAGGMVIDINAINASTDRWYVDSQMKKIGNLFDKALRYRPADVYQQMLLLPEYER